jgi:hypothetical protein
MDKIIGFIIANRKDESIIKKKSIFINDLCNRFAKKSMNLNIGNFIVCIIYQGNLEHILKQTEDGVFFYLGQCTGYYFDDIALKDRFLRVQINRDLVICENDWLGSIPLFYNSRDQIISTLSLLTLTDKTINSEGLQSYFEFGYSVFECTPFENVKFMRYYSKLVFDSDGIRIFYKDDPVTESLLNENIDEKEVLHKLEQYINYFENSYKGKIIIPTSGGYDSRLLNYFIKEKNRIRSFTYGISRKQEESFEVVRAKKVSEILGTEWQQIELQDFHKYILDWFLIFGFSTHLHGMYHIEFYKKVIGNFKPMEEVSFLSGIIGDAWAGSVNIPSIKSEKDLKYLAYSHGVNLDVKYSNLLIKNNLKTKFYKENYVKLRDPRFRTVFSMRLKILLLSYLMIVPDFLGLNSWTPFLNFDIATGMLRISESRREKRIWQKEFFSRVGLDLENMNLPSVNFNDLDYDVSRQSVFEPINAETLKSFVTLDYIKAINKTLENKNLLDDFKVQILRNRITGSVFTKIGIQNNYLKHLYAYYVIKAIEMGLTHEL